MNLSKLYSLPAERVDGKRQGYVLAAIAAGGSIVALVCADQNEREFAIEPASIVRTAGVIVYRTEAARTPKGRVLRLNVPCYDRQGVFLGHIEDYTLKQFALKSCIIRGKSYSAARLCLGDIALLGGRDGTAAAIAAKDMFLDAVVNSRTLT